MGEHTHDEGAGCLRAHGDLAADLEAGTLVAVYASPVAEVLLRWGRELGYRTVLVEPDAGRRADAAGASADQVVADPFAITSGGPDATDVVVCDHHRDDLGAVMAPLVTAAPRWIGIMGSPRHVGPHVAALRDAGLDEDLVATVRRPIGLDIGSKAPPEIALSTLAELVAHRNGREGGRPRTPPAARPVAR
jgi:xanthine dehydrogenase accessory factor